MKWKGDTASVVYHSGAMGDGVYAGKMNTAIIVAFSSARGADLTDYAAFACSNKASTGDVMYGDWYLPSQKELMLLFENKATIEAKGSAFSVLRYWSSTEHNKSSAYIVYTDGSSQQELKDNTHAVRPIRSF